MSLTTAPVSFDPIVDRAAAKAQEWVGLGPKERAALLRACLARLSGCAAQWVRLSCQAKGIDPDSSLAGEEWISGPAVTARHLRLYAETLEKRGRDSPVDAASAPVPQNGTSSRVAVFPQGFKDALMFPGLKGELRLMPAGGTGGTGGTGGVAAVLGAGNINSIPPLDGLAMLLLFDHVAVVKLNPVNDYLVEPLNEVFAPLVERGFLAFERGDAAAGAELVADPRVTHVHITGSEATYDAVVWGRPGDPADPVERGRLIVERKQAGKRSLNKAVTAELGAVSPALIVPGRWGRRDLRRQARNLAGMVAHNGSFNCNAVKLVVTARGWPQREEFMDCFREALAATPARAPWYPGAQQRWQSFVDHYPQAEKLSVDAELPWTLIPDVPCMQGEMACTVEAFCGVVAETSLDCRHPEDFLPAATAAVNVHVHGTLSCTVIAPPHTPRPALEQALDGLRYGGIGVNVWAGLIFGMGQTSWGAYPGHPPEDIQSGSGVVHNTTLRRPIEKSILRGPFRPVLKWVWQPGFRNLRALGQRWLAYESRATTTNLLRLAWPAVRG